VESTGNSVQGWKFGIRVVSSNIETTAHSLEVLETIDGDESTVVGNLKTSDRGQGVHGDVAQGGIGNEGKCSSDAG